MNNYKLTNKQISHAVTNSLNSRHWSVTTCCESFNKRFKQELKAGAMMKMDKDFVHRVRKNQFSVVSKRVVFLCEFLEVDLNSSGENQYRLKEEMEIVERAICKNPSIEGKVRLLLKNIGEIAEVTQ